MRIACRLLTGHSSFVFLIANVQFVCSFNGASLMRTHSSLASGVDDRNHAWVQGGSNHNNAMKKRVLQLVSTASLLSLSCAFSWHTVWLVAVKLILQRPRPILCMTVITINSNLTTILVCKTCIICVLLKIRSFNMAFT
jgi:hypothetical protein